ncbi:MAG: bifunctional phosphopantothenoylcysteine decarboxylase/phosphopantothenate synthase [Bacteroidota bacterium]
MNAFKNKKILLGVTGSIAAYKSPLIVRELIKAGASVRVVMTPSAAKFVSPLALNNLTKYPVALEMFDESIQSDGSWHVHLALWCDAMMIAPCSATTLSRLATGNCDTALASVALALPRQTPLVIAPAMDSDMWLHPATQRNARQVSDDGAIVIPPAHGELASGIIGVGRLPENDVLLKVLEDVLSGKSFKSEDFKRENSGESFKNSGKSREENSSKNESVKSQPFKNKNPEEHFSRAEESFKKFENSINSDFEKIGKDQSDSIQNAVESDEWNAEFELEKLKRGMSDAPNLDNLLKEKTVLITAGPTYEKIDDVRFIGNYSSGKMGFALAEAAKSSGANVILIAGPVSLKTPEGVERIDVESASEMHREVLKRFEKTDIAILSAAVADFAPQEITEGKIKKESVSGGVLKLELHSTPDILKTLGGKKEAGQFVVGFALESTNEIENGFKKMQAKNCDMIVVNSANKPQSGFKGDDNTITVLKRDGSHESFPPMPKILCAAIIVREIAKTISSVQK